MAPAETPDGTATDPTLIVDEAGRSLAAHAGRSWIDLPETEREHYREAARIVLAAARRYEALSEGALSDEVSHLP